MEMMLSRGNSKKTKTDATH